MVCDFTAHNVRLNDGTLTLPTQNETIAEGSWFKATKRALSLAFQGELEGKKIVDLGCLEGGFTAEFARLGMDALGIEVRKSNYDNCMVVKNGTNLPNLNFARDTVQNIEKYGPFDAIFCCGLLYHLDNPRQFVRTMSRLCNKVMIIHTHYATVEPIQIYNLSPVTQHEGVPGRWFIDRPQGVTEEQLDGMKWASWENANSFWIQKEYLVQEMYDNGFDMVFEQYDFLAPDVANGMGQGYCKQHNRSMFVGIKM
jgi:SAM-dependent methyltransferase